MNKKLTEIIIQSMSKLNPDDSEEMHILGMGVAIKEAAREAFNAAREAGQIGYKYHDFEEFIDFNS